MPRKKPKATRGGDGPGSENWLRSVMTSQDMTKPVVPNGKFTLNVRFKDAS